MHECIFVYCLYTRVFVCGPATLHSRREEAGGRKSVFEDFPTEMLILTAKNLATCMSRLSAFKMSNPQQQGLLSACDLLSRDLWSFLLVH